MVEGKLLEILKSNKSRSIFAYIKGPVERYMVDGITIKYNNELLEIPLESIVEFVGDPFFFNNLNRIMSVEIKGFMVKGEQYVYAKLMSLRVIRNRLNLLEPSVFSEPDYLVNLDDKFNKLVDRILEEYTAADEEVDLDRVENLQLRQLLFGLFHYGEREDAEV